MTALNTDLLKKISYSWVGEIDTAGVATAIVTTIPLKSVTNIATDTAVVAVIGRVNSAGVKTPTLEETVIGVVSGTTLINCTRGVEGTAQAHLAGAVVEIMVTAKGYNDIIDHILVQHNQDGTHTNALVTSLKASGAEVTTGTSDIKIATPKAIKDANLVVTASSTTTFTNKTSSTSTALDANADANFTYDSLYRNAIINGNFDIWQRGTTFVKSGSGWSNIVDRWGWYPQTGSGWAFTATQQAIVAGELDGSNYCLRVQRDAGNTSIGQWRFGQSLETLNSIPFCGRKITLSFYARCGANYSPTSNAMSILFVTGTGVDGNMRNGYTGYGEAGTSTVNLTTSWAKYTLTSTAVIASTVKQIGVTFYFTPVGTAGAADYLEIAQVQLNAGSVALPYSPKSLYVEQQDCDRYCQAFVTTGTSEVLAQGSGTTATTANFLFDFRNSMRTTPTLVATAADWQVDQGGSLVKDVTGLVIKANYFGPNGGLLTATTATGLTTNVPYALRGDGTVGRTLIFSAEL